MHWYNGVKITEAVQAIEVIVCHLNIHPVKQEEKCMRKMPIWSSLQCADRVNVFLLLCVLFLFRF